MTPSPLRRLVSSWVVPLLLALGVCQGLLAQTSNPSSIVFDEYTGTLISVRQSLLKLQTAEGEKTFRIVQARNDTPQLGVGRPTSVSIKGVDRISFIEEGMVVRLEASLDAQRRSAHPVEKLDVISLSKKAETSRDRIGEPDPVSGVALYRITGRVQSIEQEGKRLGLIARTNGRSERFEIEVNPESTQVRYDLPELSLAKEGETVLVRCPPVNAPTLIASEIRIERGTPFGAEAADPNSEPAATDAAADEPDEPEETEHNPLAQMAETEPGDALLDGANADGDSAEAGLAAEAGREPRAAEGPGGDLVEFDFQPSEDGNPAIDLGFFRVVLGLKDRSSENEREQPIIPAKMRRSVEPRPSPPGRSWFKIN